MCLKISSPPPFQQHTSIIRKATKINGTTIIVRLCSLTFVLQLTVVDDEPYFQVVSPQKNGIV